MRRLLLKSALVVMMVFGGLMPVFGADCVGEQCNIYRGPEYYGEPVLSPRERRDRDEAKLPAKERNALKLMREKSRLRRKEMALQADIKRRAEQQRQWNRAAEQEKAREVVRRGLGSRNADNASLDSTGKMISTRRLFARPWAG